MFACCLKFRILLLKHLIVRLFHFILTIFELLLPIVIALMIVWLQKEEMANMEGVLRIFGNLPGRDETYGSMNLWSKARGSRFSVTYFPDNWYTQSLKQFARESQSDVNFKPERPNPYDACAISFENGFSDDPKIIPDVLEYTLTIPPPNGRKAGLDYKNTFGKVIVAHHLVAVHHIALHRVGEEYPRDPSHLAEIGREVEVNTHRMPMPDREDISLYIYMMSTVIFGYLVPCCFIFIIPSLLTQIVMEKQNGIKELLRLSGLPTWIQWLAFFVNSFVLLCISAIAVAIIFTNLALAESDVQRHEYDYTSETDEETKVFSAGFHPVKSQAVSMLEKAGTGHVILIFILYVISCIAFCFFLSTLFTNATRATLCGLLIWWLTFVLPFVMTSPGKIGGLSFVEKLFMSLLPNMCLFFSLRFVALQERQEGVTWENYIAATSLAEETILLPLLLMFLVDTLLFMLLAWYLDQLFPGQYGMPKRWNFCVASCVKRPPPPPDSESSASQPSKAGVNQNIENEPRNLERIIEAQYISKEFKTGWCRPAFLAVDQVNLNVYRGEIFVLLGHNGAGKSVTMSMITGTYVPTSGSVFINEYDIRKDINKAREGVSFCPQANMFFPELSVQQHFRFFGTLKGLKGSGLKKEVSELISRLNLEELRKKRVGILSGGTQRRVQFGLAVIGDVDVLVLDEPTSGMDPEFRRVIWDILLEQRDECCILLCTHYMEEADALADRIAIMAHGKIVVCGSPMFLRNRFGADYIMKVTKGVGCNTADVLKYVRRQVPDAFIAMETRTEISIELPIGQKSAFPNLFRDVEKNLNNLKISDFGLATMSLDEIFVKVYDQTEGQDERRNQAGATGRESSLEVMKYPALCCQRFRGLMMKRIYYVWHRLIVFVSQLVVIIVTAILVLAMLKTKLYRAKTHTTGLFEDVFASPKRQMVFEHHQYKDVKVPICLHEAYLRNIPEHVKVKSETGRIEDFQNTIMEFAKADLLGFENGHYGVGASFVGPVEFSQEDDTDYGRKDGTEDTTEKVPIKSVINATAWYYRKWYMEDMTHELEVDNIRKIASLALVYNAFLQNCDANSKKKIVVKAQMKNLKEDDKERIPLELAFGPWLYFETLLKRAAASFLAFGVCLVVCGFIALVSQEQKSGFKHMQIMTGTGKFHFWVSAFLFDYFVYLIYISCCIIILVIFGSNVATKTSFGIIFAAMLLFGWCALPFAYVISFWKTTVTKAYVLLLIIYILSVFVFATIHVNVEDKPEGTDYHQPSHDYGPPNHDYGPPNHDYGQPSYDDGDVVGRRHGGSPPSTDTPIHTVIILAVMEFLLPGCALTVVFVKRLVPQTPSPSDIYSKRSSDISEARGYGMGLGQRKRVDSNSDRQLFMLFLGGLFYMLLILLIELCAKIQKPKKPAEAEDEEPDVDAETKRVLRILDGQEESEDILLVENLTKIYGRKMVVDHLTFGVEKDECFGLLGVNGAGKTTAFKMLTGFVSMGNGDALLDDFSLRKQRTKYLSQLGYCPQFDALIDQFTSREILIIFSRLRGLKNEDIDSVVDRLIQQFRLTEYANKTTGIYSLGTKRKISAAVAVIGNPTMVMLDEPTTGVDPASRRKMWEVIAASKAMGTAFILTSHSMDECEVLCSRLAIMKKGKFKCLGPVQYLKSKFGKGFKVNMRLPMDVDEAERERIHRDLDKFMEQKFKDCTIKVERKGLVEYSIPYTSAEWQKMFTTLEEAKKKFNLNDYSVCQATLEEVFLDFASEG